MGNFEREQTVWLWERRIPMGSIVMLDGDPGGRKTWLALDLAARVTRGHEMPCEENPQLIRGGAAIISYEDSPGRTIRPRFEDAGGDASELYVMAPGQRFTLCDRDCDLLQQYIELYGLRLVIFDTFSACLPGGKSMNSDQDVRQCLAPFWAMAEKTQCVLLFIRHMNKGSGSALYKGAGSIGITGAARSVLICAKDETDCSHVGVAKCNLAPRPPLVSYRVEDNRLRYSLAHGKTVEGLANPRKPNAKKETSAERTQEQKPGREPRPRAPRLRAAPENDEIPF